MSRTSTTATATPATNPKATPPMTAAEARDILPYMARGSTRPPAPILVVRKVACVGGALIQYSGERWRAEDTWACPHRDELEVDPSRPGEMFAIRLIDLSTGRPVEWMSPEQAEALLAGCPRSPLPAPPFRTAGG